LQSWGWRRDAIVAAHGFFDTLIEPALDDLTKGVEQRVELLAFLAGETIEHVVSQVVVVHRSRPHTDAEPGIVLTAQCPLDALQAVVPPGASRSAQSEAAEVERDFVDQDEEIAGRVEVGILEERP
jgi:hypothetical protein